MTTRERLHRIIDEMDPAHAGGLLVVLEPENDAATEPHGDVPRGDIGVSTFDRHFQQFRLTTLRLDTCGVAIPGASCPVSEPG